MLIAKKLRPGAVLICAKIIHQAQKLMMKPFAAPDLPKDERLLRDIGVNPAELSFHRVELPSQTNVHPRL